MIYNFIEAMRDWLSAHGLGFFRVFTYIEFRAVMAILIAFAFVWATGPTVIRWLVRQKIGDTGGFDHAELDELMKAKSSTPTMGGVMICGAILTATVLLADLTSFYVQMGLVCLIWLCALGMADDWLKLTTARRDPGSRDGLKSWEKLVFQLGLAVLLGLFIHHYGVNKYQMDPFEFGKMSHALTLPFFKTWQMQPGTGMWIPAQGLIVLGTWPFVILSILVIAGSSNAVNLTDGMDGLASGVMTVVAFAFMVLALIAGYVHPDTDFILAQYLLVPYIPKSAELAIMAGAMAGACLGFLWYNCHPARVFMGDTGSLPLGGLIGYIAVVIRQEFLLLLIGGIFVIEAVSVIMQIGYFRLSGGKRIFKCAPIHHHFHLLGWTEQQVVVRFWVLSAMFAALALATIKLR